MTGSVSRCNTPCVRDRLVGKAKYSVLRAVYFIAPVCSTAATNRSSTGSGYNSGKPSRSLGSLSLISNRSPRCPPSRLQCRWRAVNTHTKSLRKSSHAKAETSPGLDASKKKNHGHLYCSNPRPRQPNGHAESPGQRRCLHRVGQAA